MIAMWSGPRNISTALMRAWGNRQDTVVWDEPLYAHYLTCTARPHPGADEVVASHESNWKEVVAQMNDPLPPGKSILYQKQMAHHLLPQIDRAFLERVSNCLLIRQPCEMLLSLLDFLPNPSIDETGLPQQWEICQHLEASTGQSPPIVDAADLLQSPRAMLTCLCEQIGVPFDPQMLSWPRGPRITDGVWGKHWYAKVYETTGFAPYRPRCGSVPQNTRGLLQDCESIYQRLYERRVRTGSP